MKKLVTLMMLVAMVGIVVIRLQFLAMTTAFGSAVRTDRNRIVVAAQSFLTIKNGVPGRIALPPTMP